jgi:transposase
MKEQETRKRRRQRTPNNLTTTGFRLSNQLWAVLQPLLPVHVNTHRFGGGRPRVADRCCADAIFYVLRTGCQWQALDQTELCAHSTAHNRFQVWVQAGVFLKLWQVGVEQFDELCGINWDWLSMDSVTMQLVEKLLARGFDPFCFHFPCRAHFPKAAQAKQFVTLPS